VLTGGTRRHSAWGIGSRLILSFVVLGAVLSRAGQPAGTRAASPASSLPAVSSGARPGPDVLYAPPPVAPQLENRDPRFKAAPSLVSGTEAYVNGEYLYQDYLYDDYGSDTDGFGGSPLSQRTGDIDYPTNGGRYGGNAADLVEFRIAAAPDSVTYRITLNTLLQADSTIVVIAYDTDQNVATGGAILPRDPGAPFPGTDEVIATWGIGAEHSRWTGAGWVTTPLTVTTDLEANQITVTVPRSVSNPTLTWRATVAAGLYDPVTGGWLRPQPTADDIHPGGAGPLDLAPTGIFNLAFRFDEPVTGRDTPPDTNQAVALRNKQPTRYAHNIDFAALAAGANSSTVPAAGTQIRIFPSRLQLGEGRDLNKFPAYLGQLQPYSLYVPTAAHCEQGAKPGLTLDLHSLLEHYWQYNGTSMVQQIGEQRCSFVATSLSRGKDGWFEDFAEYDVFEMWNDIAARFALDPDRVAISGYSMGGYATYRLGTLYPDLFGKALSVVGPPGEGIWIPPLPPTGSGRGLGPAPAFPAPATLTNLWLENARNLPYMNLAGGQDELVPFAGARAQNLGAPEYGVQGFDQLSYRFHFLVYDVSDHLALAILDNYPMAADFLGDAHVDRNPTHVTFAYVPAADDPTHGLVHNHAYWVSNLQVADPTRNPYPQPDPRTAFGFPGKGVVDAFSHAFGLGDPPSTSGQFQCVTPGSPSQCGPLPYTEFNRTWGDSPPIAPQNRLDVKLSNLAAVTVDARRAKLQLCQTISLFTDTDSSSQLLLAGPITAASVTGASFQQRSDGVVLLLQPGQTEVTIVPSCALPDLQVSNIVASNNRAREGEKVSISATIANTGQGGAAAASKTEFLLDATIALGLVDTPAIPSGSAVSVSVLWDTRGVKGDHTIRVTADTTGLVAESNEANNVATLPVTVIGNRVKNGSFEQANASGSGPEAWSASNTGAGTANWSVGGSDGLRSASVNGSGGSVALNGSPTWTSDPIAVTPGEVLSLVVSVRSTGMSSPGAAGIAYLSATGELLNTVTLLTTPLTTNGFTSIEQSVTVPSGVSEVRVTLAGFAFTDPATLGEVTFDDVGLFGT